MNQDGGDETLFSAKFPLPFRVLFLIGLGILAWATNLHGLQFLGVNAAGALDLHRHHRRTPYGSRSPLPTSRLGWKFMPDPQSTYNPLYKLCFQYSLFTGVAWMLYQHSTRSELELVDIFKFIPAVTGLLLFMLLVSPFKLFERSERDAFLNSIYRCCFGSSDRPTSFADIVFADVFTSFAKVLGDVWLSICILLPGGSLLVPPPQKGLSRWILPTIMSLPYAIRFRQCIIDYLHPTNQSRKPLYNAFKYASSFPVIYLSAAQRIVVTDLLVFGSPGVQKEEWFGEITLFRLWLLAAAVNSLYSIWWDVTNDWGFDLLTPRTSRGNLRSGSRTPPKRLVLPHLHSRSALLTSPSAAEEKEAADEGESEIDVNLLHPHSRPRPLLEQNRYPFGLRPILLFPLPIYPFIIVMDLVLRMTWSAKLSAHLHSFAQGDLIIFWVEIAEVIRRWMWLFIRVEWEVVKSREGYTSSQRDGLFHGHDSDAYAPSPSRISHLPEQEYEMISSNRSDSVTNTG